MTYAFDVPAPELLARYLRGDLTPDERVRVTDWLAGDPTRATELETLRLILDAGGAQPHWDLDRVWAGIERGMGRPRPAPRFTLAERPRWWAVRRAAAAVLLLGAGTATALTLGRGGDAPPAVGPSVVTTARAQRLSMRLPDSTLVVLAPESRLEIAADYGRPMRRVMLEGRATFTVVHDERHPFAVETPGAVARDLGTHFAVSAYPGDSVAQVAVAEGTVAVARRGVSDSLVVRPGEVARVNADGRLDVVRGAALERFFDWTEGALAFEKTPLGEVADELQRWYDIEVAFADSTLRSKRVTATFRNEPPEQILQTVAGVVGLEVVRLDGTHVLRQRP